MPTAAPDVFALAAQVFQPKVRRWATPGAMAQELEPWNGITGEESTGTRQSPLLEAIDRNLVDLTESKLPEGRGNRLMVFCPPQEGKSSRISNWFPAWLLADNPRRRIAIMSASSDLAVGFGKRVREIILGNPELGVRLKPDSRAMDDWQTIEGGGLRCVGRDSLLTGKPVDILIIDDPFTSQEDAMSPTTRRKVWSWWEAVATARMPRAVVLVNTRWHEDDLAGRLETRQPGRWTVLSMPAIADSPNDPLGREIGEEMRSVRDQVLTYQVEAKAEGRPGYYYDLKASISPFVFSAVWQQRPTPAEGGLFRVDGWRYFTLGPHESHQVTVQGDGMQPWPLADCLRFLTVDLASSTRTSADYTVAAVWAVTPDGQLLLLDQVRRRMPITEHWGVVRSLREKWDAGTVYVESRMFGTTLVYEAGRAGIPIEELDADTDKVTRAIPAADRQQQGTLWLPQGAPWLHDWLTEVTTFPNAAHDDQVDCLGYAARVAAAHWLRPVGPSNYPEPTYSSPFDLADSALAAPGLDLMAVNY